MRDDFCDWCPLINILKVAKSARTLTYYFISIHRCWLDGTYHATKSYSQGNVSRNLGNEIASISLLSFLLLFHVMFVIFYIAT